MLVLKCLECGEIHEIEECEKEAAGQFGCARCCGGELDIIDEYETGKGFYCPCGCRGNLDECVYASTCCICGKKFVGHGYGRKIDPCPACAENIVKNAIPITKGG